MATELTPPELPTTADATTAADALPSQPETAPLRQSPQTAPPPPPPPPPQPQKRQRRPSVRLGEIGDQPASLSFDHSHLRKSSPATWRVHNNSSSTYSSKSAKSLTNRDNINSVKHDNDSDLATENARNGDVGKRQKSRRRGQAKRARSNWIMNLVEDDKDSGGDEAEYHHTNSDVKRDTGTRAVRGREKDAAAFGVDSDFDYRVHDGEENVDTNNENVDKRQGVRSWLIELGLSRYAPVFDVHEVDDEVLPFLTLEDLKDMGITAVGSRRKLYAAIQKLRKGFS